jgi:hypothetical protein
MNNHTSKEKAGTSLRDAALQVLRESALGPNVAYADPPKKLNPAPLQGGVEDTQNTNNVAGKNIGALNAGAREMTGRVGGGNTGATDSAASISGGPKRLNPEGFQGNIQDLGDALTDGTGPGMEVPPSMRGNDSVTRTSRVPGGKYPAQETYNPTDRKIFAEASKKDDEDYEDDEDEKDDDEDEDMKNVKEEDGDEYYSEEDEEYYSEEEKDDEDEDDEKDDDEDDDEKDMKKEDYEPLTAEEVIDLGIQSVNVNEHIAALLSNGGNNLSEEFMQKTSVVFEAALREMATEMYAALNESFTHALEEATENYEEALTEHVDNYLGYVVEQWIAENEVAIESGLRSELTEDFINGLHKLFSENYIDVPESKVDLVEELAKKVNTLESKLNEEFENSVRLHKELVEARKSEIFSESTRDLTDFQAEKLKDLSRNVVFESVNDYAEKLQTLKESYFSSAPSSSRTTNHLSSGMSDGNSLDGVDPTTAEAGKNNGSYLSEEVNPRMARYLNTLSRQVKSPTFRDGNK